MIRRLVVLGASGDLTGRFLLPAVAQLSGAGRLPDDFTVLGAAQESWDDDRFRRHAAEQLERHASDVPAAVRAALVAGARYRQVDVTDPASVAAALTGPGGAPDADPFVAYLALPTGLVPAAIEAVGAAGLPHGSRIAVEKPFGEDLRSARELNGLLRSVLGERAEDVVFRVDHALGMTPLQNLLALRFANRFPEALLSSEHVAEVEVLWEETLALEGRAGFYDRAGALTDVMQNHMVQLLCMIAVERPDAAFHADALRLRKVELLRSVRRLSEDDVVRSSRRARYTAGRLAGPEGAGGDRAVPDYTAEEGVDPRRDTETFAEVVLAVDNERWSGTRFRMRAGKALSERRKGILLTFRPPVRSTERDADGGRLWIGIDGPQDVSLTLRGLAAAGSEGPADLVLAGPQPQPALSPYAHVLLDLLAGGSTLSVGDAEAELAWQVLDPVKQAWDRGLVPMEEYVAGTGGPAR